MSGGNTWAWDTDGNGFSEVFSTHPNLSFAHDDPDVVWAVMNMAEMGDYISEEVEMQANSCNNWDFYIPTLSDRTNWSMDLWVLKSIDGGTTWSDPVNVTNTPGYFQDGVYNGPEEMYPHTPAFSDSENVYFMYQMPNWEWNELGDPATEDHMNYVFVGYAGEDIDFEDQCSNDIVGDVNSDGELNILDILQMVSYIFENTNFTECQIINADFDGDNIINIADLVLAVNCILSDC